MMLPSLVTCEANRSLDARSWAFSFSSCSIRDDSNMRRSRSSSARSSASCCRSAASPVSGDSARPGSPNASSARSASINQRPVGFDSLLGAHPRNGAGGAVPFSETHIVTVFEVTLAISATVAAVYARRKPTSGSTARYSRTLDIGNYRTRSNLNGCGSNPNRADRSHSNTARTHSEMSRRITDALPPNELHVRSFSRRGMGPARP